MLSVFYRGGYTIVSLLWEADEMRKHRIGVAVVCVVFVAAAWGPIAAAQGRRPLPGPEFGRPVPYKGWKPWHNDLFFSTTRQKARKVT